jgi:fluoroquinolone transport system permease protein
MRRIAATLRCDVRVQFRNGFYYASALVVVASVILLRWLPEEAVAWLLPLVIFENVMMNTFYFVAGLILLERGEGTLEAQAVTPLRAGEYLASKVITLGVLSLVESLLISTLARGASPGVIPLALGIMLASVFLCLVGVALVLRYRSINEFLMPSVPYTIVLSLPLFGYLGIGPAFIYDWHPIQGSLALMAAGTEPVEAGRLVYAIVLPLLWVAPVYFWSRRALRRRMLR